MEFSLLGYSFDIGYWDQWFVCYGLSLFFIIQCLMVSPPEVTGRDDSVDSGAVCGIFLFVPPIMAFVAPLAIIIFSGMFVVNNKDFLEGYKEFKGLQSTWFSKFINLDYITIFMPVVCVLTLFLLD